MISCSFSLPHFKEILEIINKNFITSTFRDSSHPLERSKPITYLRHDIDHSLEDALTMASLEEATGIRATYFIQLHSTFYTITDTHGHQILQKIKSMGHEIGFHYDISYYKLLNRPTLSAFKQDLAFMRDLIEEDIVSIVRHDPAAGTIDAALQQQINTQALYNPYDDKFFKAIRYVADSTCHWRNGCCCNYLQELKDIQVLIHPIWWVNDAVKWQDKLRQSQQRHTSQYAKNVADIIAYYQNALNNRQERDKQFQA